MKSLFTSTAIDQIVDDVLQNYNRGGHASPIKAGTKSSERKRLSKSDEQKKALIKKALSSIKVTDEEYNNIEAGLATLQARMTSAIADGFREGFVRQRDNHPQPKSPNHAKRAATFGLTAAAGYGFIPWTMDYIAKKFGAEAKVASQVATKEVVKQAAPVVTEAAQTAAKEAVRQAAPVVTEAAQTAAKTAAKETVKQAVPTLAEEAVKVVAASGAAVVTNEMVNTVGNETASLLNETLCNTTLVNDTVSSVGNATVNATAAAVNSTLVNDTLAAASNATASIFTLDNATGFLQDNAGWFAIVALTAGVYAASRLYHSYSAKEVDYKSDDYKVLAITDIANAQIEAVKADLQKADDNEPKTPVIK